MTESLWMRVGLFAAVLPSLPLSGCVDLDCASLPSEETAIEPRSATLGGTSVQDGDALPVERGSQGGVHLRNTVRIEGLYPGSPTRQQGLQRGDLPTIRWSLAAGSEDLTADNPQLSVLAEADEGGWLAGPHLVIFSRRLAGFEDESIEVIEAEIAARDLLLAVQATDVCGTSIATERSIRVEFPEP